MLSRRNRVNKKDVDLIFRVCPPSGRDGRSLTSTNFAFKFFNTKDGLPPRISFLAPKNIAKLAVKRNLLRRRGYTALKKYIDQFPVGLLGVFMFKKYQDDLLIIEEEIKSIYKKI